MFKAILIERDERPYRAGFTALNEARLPAGDVTVRVDYSTLNCKDAHPSSCAA
jgi:acrylyl-CoA reductase (NADPH)